MPYIKDEQKEEMWITFDGRIPNSAGELNYCFTAILNEYLKKKGESYQTYNDIVGALENAKLEIYRRKISLYEDKAIERNGDVYN